MRVNSFAIPGHVTIPNVELRLRVTLTGALACAAVAIAALLLRRDLPVGAWYALKSAATLAFVMAIAAWQVPLHHPYAKLGPANQMTIVRAALTALVAGLTGELPSVSTAAAATGLAVMVEVLDGADGWLARRSGIVSEFGARFDMEVDALLIMALSVLAWQHGKAGAWVLLSGLMRYAFVAAGWIAPWLERPLPYSRRRQTVCVVQIVTLCVVVSPVVSPLWTPALAAVALCALAASFLVDVGWLWRARPAVAV
jgi:phosphatidylglycerophosphate synthase